MQLIKIGTEWLEAPYILDHTYTVENIRETVLSEATLDGVLHEVVSPHARHVVSFASGFLTMEQIAWLRQLLSANYTDAAARRLQVTYYDIENAGYTEGDFRLAGLNYGVLVADAVRLFTRPVELSFAEY